MKKKATKPFTGAYIARQRREREDVARQWVDHAARRYQQTKNPVFAWEAIAECLATDLPLPDWTCLYLRTVAREFTELSRGRVPSKGGIDKAVAKAVGLQGRGGFNPFREIAESAHEISIALRVYRHQTANRRRHAEGKGAEFSWAAIFEDVAREHNERCNCKKRLGAGTVKTVWYENALSVIPPHLVAQSKSKKLDDILR